MRNTKFTINDRQTGDPIREVTVNDYFWEDKKHKLQKPHLPCVKTTKDQLFPVEVCEIEIGQHYKYRLDDFQVRGIRTR